VPSRRLLLIDAAAALAVGAAYLSFAAFDGSDGTPVFTGPAWLAWLTAAAVGLPLAVRRLWPIAGASVVVLGCAAASVLDITREPFVPAALALYSVGALVGRRRSIAMLASAFAALGGGLVVGVYVTTPSENLVGTATLVAAVWAIAAIGWAAGVMVRRKRADAERAAASERARVVTEERMRIARELHDIVSHSLSLIAVQAGVANHIADEHPERAREAMRSIETTSRDALAEMRSVLTVLRDDSVSPGTREPVPSLDDLEALVDRARAAGVAVDANIEVRVRVPDGVALAVYRVVQESLTNTVKHAGGGRCEVTVRADHTEIRAEIVDDGARQGSSGGGHGLIGMRERVLMYGGTFTAGPVAEGGFAVRAVLPLKGGEAR
jgi:signal transduction histidine kinase